MRRQIRVYPCTLAIHAHVLTHAYTQVLCSTWEMDLANPMPESLAHVSATALEYSDYYSQKVQNYDKFVRI
jgi:hypothetical protein